MSSAFETRYTPEQYLALERKSEIKHEYHRGEMFAMAGASREHNLIAVNVSSVLRNQLLTRPCETYAGDMRILVRPTSLYVYPDIVAVCGEPSFVDSHSDTLLNPTAIIEILSPSTEAYDRGEKFAQYRKIASLRNYVLIAQDEVRVERFTRRGDEWVLTEWTGLDDVGRLDAIDCELPLRDVYAKVNLGAVEHVANDPGNGD